jgi:hypothetical protein
LRWKGANVVAALGAPVMVEPGTTENPVTIDSGPPPNVEP